MSTGKQDTQRTSGAHAIERGTHATYSREAFTQSPARTRALERKRRRRRRRVIIGSIVGVIVVLLAAVALFGYSQYRALQRVEATLKADAAAIMTDVSALQDDLTARDFAAAADTEQHLLARARHMRELLSAEEFDFAERIPTYGSDVTGARTLVDTLITLTEDALIPCTQTLVDNPISGLYTSDGGINLASLYTLLDAVDPAIPVVEESLATLASLEEFHLPQMQELITPALAKVDDLKDTFTQAASLLHDIKPIVMALLGEDGTKNYLIAAQNSAEMRATGGFPGALGLLMIRDGQFTLGDFGRPYELMADRVDASYGITDVEMAASRSQMKYQRDAGYLPDFARAAWIWARGYEEENGIHVDGVISLTPSIVQRVLEIAGPITLEDGTVLDGTNATRVLQHDLYWDYLSRYTQRWWSATYVDELFAQAAKLAFHALMDNANSDTVMQLVDVALASVESGEAMLWLADEADQAAIAGLGCSGTLNEDPTAPVVGVFFNTYVPSKTAWWLDQTTTIGEGVKNADGTTTYRVESTFANAISADEARTGGNYIMGSYAYGVMEPIIELVAPAGGSIAGVEDNLGFSWVEADYEGHQMIYDTAGAIRPGETLVVTFTVTVSADAAADLAWRSQPTLTAYRLA